MQLSRINSFFRNENLPARFTLKKSDEELQDAIIDFNDLLLDRVGNFLDEFEGLKSKDEELVLATLNLPSGTDGRNRYQIASWNKKQTPSLSPGSQSQFKKLQISNLPKPQLRFRTQIDNTNQIFRPKLLEKHNNLTPLVLMPQEDENGNMYYPHPYKDELNAFNPTPDRLRKSTAIPYASLESTPLEYIETEAQLQKLLVKLLQANEFAVDLEYHNYRSFTGFTSLMQISTRTEDFIIDTLELRDELHILNEAFTDPKILKVFHGGEFDVEYLQKDFGIYVVNMFDTCQAARLLQMAHYSLSYLVKHYCSVTLNKEYQLADWRIRPLPQEMVEYARCDTHYLLYVYDQMRNELIVNGKGDKLIKLAYERSKGICLRRFEMPITDDKSHLLFVNSAAHHMNNRQIEALKGLFYWRDQLARQEDESVGYILPNHMMLKIAEVLPREMQGIIACCNPIPVMVRRYLADLHQIVLKARDLPIEVNKQSGANNLQAKITLLLDITHQVDVVDDERVNRAHHLDCLLEKSGQNHHKIILKQQPESISSDTVLSFLSSKPETDPFRLAQLSKFKTPYQRYCDELEKQKAMNAAKLNQMEIDDMAKQQSEEQDEARVKRALEVDPDDLISHSRKKAKSELEYDKIMETKPLKHVMRKGKEVKQSGQQQLSSQVDCDITQLLQDAKLKAGEALSESPIKKLKTDQAQTPVNFESANFDIFTKKSEDQPDTNYFDPSKEFLNQKQVSSNMRLFTQFNLISLIY